MSTFILLGAAGFVAPRHMAAIRSVGGDLVAAVDPCDSVGVLDSYFPKCRFYKNHLDCFENEHADYVVICTPNHLHAIQACQAMQAGMDVIVEKPAAISATHLAELLEVERITGKRANCILNMRLHHDAVLMGAHEPERLPGSQIDIEYHTPRGPWYQQSWKSNHSKSGGLLFNIGIHLLDLALNVFGKCRKSDVAVSQNQAEGVLQLERGTVQFRLSINGRPKSRTFTVNGLEYDFTNGFDDLHTASYQAILNGNGFGLEDARPAIELCEKLSS
jgi:UDP-N-acetyl-2-amino-2-deoxyglucuronate dehydrogenase